MTSGPRIGFIGLGNMGWPMAANLVRAGLDVTVRDLSSDRQERFVAEFGCGGAATSAGFEGIDLLVTMLPDGRAVREAVLGWDGGVAARLAPGATVIDTSSSHPDDTLALGRDLADSGIAVVDAPVSGGIPRAEAGTLTLMIGADSDAAVDAAAPVLEVVGERLFRTGRLGSGHATKALNNFVGAAAYAAISDALAVAEHYGVGAETLVDVMNTSTGRSFYTEVVYKDHVVTGRYATGFALGLLAKDVAIAAALASAHNVSAPVLELVSERWSDAAEKLGFAADHSEARRAW